MKKIFLLLSILVVTVSSFASVQMIPEYSESHVKKWGVSFKTPEGMPVFDYIDSIVTRTTWGQQNVYNVLTDGGFSDRLITAARWATIINNSISRIIYWSAGNWNFANIYLQYPSNIKHVGDGSNPLATHFRLLDTVQTSNSIEGKNYWFVSFGKSNISNQDYHITCGGHRMTAIFKFNTKDTSNSQECSNVSFDGMRIDSSRATGIRLGQLGGGETHHLVGFRVTNSELGWLSNNQTTPWVVVDGASDTSKCHGIDEGSSTWDDYLFKNWIHDNSGDGINSNTTGWANSNGEVTNKKIGNFVRLYNTIERTYSCIVDIGNYIWNPIYKNNKLRDPTNEGGFLLSIQTQDADIEGNEGDTYENRTPYEVYGIGNHIDFFHTVSHIGRSTNPASWRVNKYGQTQLMYTGGWNNTFWGEIGYDSLNGVSPYVADQLRGVLISQRSQTGYQPSSWEGITDAYGFYFHCTISGVTGRAIFAENPNVQVSNVCLYSDCTIRTTAWRSGENLVQIFAPAATTQKKGWYCYDALFDVNASTSPDSTYTIFGFIKFVNTSNGLVPVPSDIRTRSGIYGARLYQNNNAKIYTNNQFEPGAAILPRVVTQNSIKTRTN